MSRDSQAVAYAIKAATFSESVTTAGDMPVVSSHEGADILFTTSETRGELAERANEKYARPKLKEHQKAKERSRDPSLIIKEEAQRYCTSQS